MRERGFRSEIRDGERLLQRERAGHDFAIDSAEGFVGDRPGVLFADAGEHGEFAMRRIDFLARLEFDLADGQDVLGALIEQPDDLRVQFINRLAMLG